VKITNNLLVLKPIVLSLAIGWTIIIALLCLIQSGDLPHIGISGIDKYVHFGMHFVYTLLWSYYFNVSLSNATFKKLVFVAISSLFYGILLEFAQEYFTTTRHADVFDVMANSTGAITALCLLAILLKIQQKENTPSATK
jgi:VanZ family protein